MEVILAHTAGFCMGVSLALKKLDTALEGEQQGRICTLGPIIHNPQVLEYYAGLGVHCLTSDDAVNKEDYIIVRAHGIPQHEEARLMQSGATIIDATCPKVKKAQLAIAKATKNGSELLLFGEEDHPEVRGLLSYAIHGSHVFDSLEKLYTIKLAPSTSYVLASQTTQDGKIFADINTYLQDKLQSLPVLSTICHATQERQEEIMRIATEVDAVVVVGGKASGNTCRLADVASAKGIPTWHVETVHELDPEKFSLFSRIGLTAGASTPKRLIDEVHSFLANI